jgi:hypothetical protein
LADGQSTVEDLVNYKPHQTDKLYKPMNPTNTINLLSDDLYHKFVHTEGLWEELRGGDIYERERHE